MNWEYVKLSDIASSQYGFTASATQEKVGPKFLRITDIVPRSIDWESVPFCSADDKTRKKYGLSVGDIVVARTGATTGYAKLIREEVDTVFASYLVRFKVFDDRALPSFVGRLMESSTYKSYVNGIKGGAAQPNANAVTLGNFEFRLPPKDQQERIISILSAYDDLIENNRRRIALLEQAARLLYREWFVHFRFPGSETATFVDGLPVGWERKKLGEVCTTNKRSHKKGKLPRTVRYVDIGSVSTGHIDEVTEYEPEDAPGRARRIAEPMDTIWSNVRPNLRAYSLVMSPRENDVFSTGFTVLHAETVSPFFLYCTVTSEEFVRHLMNHATGASYPAVRSDDFERAGVILPTSGLMDDFHSHAQPIFRQRQKIFDQNIALSKARDILLPRLLDGRISVDV